MRVFEPAPYEIIYADFPWKRTPQGTAKTPYQTMEWSEIEAWDWRPWLAKRSVIFLWSTCATHVKECAIMQNWCDRFNLRPIGIPFVWVKTNRATGEILGATGPRPTLVKGSAVEQVLALTNVKRGRPFPLLTESMRQVECAPRGKHSRKPPVFRQRIVELLGDRPRVELFARESAPGWDCWGNEAPCAVDGDLLG